MADMVVMEMRDKNETPSPQKLQTTVNDVAKQFAALLLVLKTPGLTGPDLLKAIQAHQNAKPDVSGPSNN